MVALIASSIWRVMSIISFSPFGLTVMIIVITDISITIENSTFILLYDQLRPFDEAPVTSNKNFLMNLQLFCISLAPNVSLSGVLTRCPKIGSRLQTVPEEQSSLVN